MKRVLLWLLPVVDVFKLRRILEYYRSIGVRVPLRHAKLGLVERWVGYLPAGLATGWILNFPAAVLIILAACAIAGPPELLLMARGVAPWKFFHGQPLRTICTVFLLEAYNAAGYFLLGALIGSVL